MHSRPLTRCFDAEFPGAEVLRFYGTRARTRYDHFAVLSVPYPVRPPTRRCTGLRAARSRIASALVLRVRLKGGELGCWATARNGRIRRAFGARDSFQPR